MGYVIKANRYRIVDNHSFEMPLPLGFSVYKKDFPVAHYSIAADEAVTYEILTKYKEYMLTTIQRPLYIADIYYLFSCRVFQDCTPFTIPSLNRLELKKYNVYDILRKTHGVTPFDECWLMFDGESLTYDEVKARFSELMLPVSEEQTEAPPMSLPEVPAAPRTPAEIQQIEKVEEVLSQHKVDTSSYKKDDVSASAAPAAFIPEPTVSDRPFENNKMSQAEIEKLLNSAGITTENSKLSVTPAPSYEDEMAISELNDAQIAKLMEKAVPAPEVALPPVQESGNMSDDAIARLFSENSTMPEPEEPKSADKMSDDDIADLIASAGNATALIPDNPLTTLASEPAPENPTKTEDDVSSGAMSQEDISRLIASASADIGLSAEPAPTAEEPSGGKMSQADIEKLFSANSAPETPAEPAPTAEEPSGGKMSQADIEKLLSSMQDEAQK